MSENSKVLFGGVAAAVVVVLLSFAGWGLKVLLSDPVGQGNAIIKKNDANNRIAKQEQFEDLNAEFDTALRNVETLTAVAKQDPTTFNKTNATGAVTYCTSVANDYNALSRKYTAADFKAVDLPASLDASLCTVGVVR